MMNKIRIALLFTLSIAFISGCSSFGSAMKASPSGIHAMGLATISQEDIEDEYTDEDSKWYAYKGLRVHYKDKGEGEPIILLHGIMSSLHTWDDWAKTLEKNYRVIRMDLPGFGLTGPLTEDMNYDKDEFITFINSFSHMLELEQFALAGNSLGGYMSAHYAAAYPERVSKLVLLDPVAYPQDVPWVIRMANMPGIWHISKKVVPPLMVSMNVEEVYGDKNRIKPEHMRRYVQLSMRKGNRESYAEVLKLIYEKSKPGQEDFPFNRIQAPTLLMWGEADKWVPTSQIPNWERDITNTQTIVYPGVGHVPMEETPKQTVKDLIKFLKDENPQPVKTEVKTASKEESQEQPATEVELAPAA
ncbi:alpha/beta fold hydrolase [Litoribrevibacter euphylliae]|uniref:Alpha/beta fold hydrolase n=1 Tax=Litoribrevibacter euphylliae TaxID=1834034 RepID=A0ABV7HH34_9GAMM